MARFCKRIHFKVKDRLRGLVKGMLIPANVYIDYTPGKTLCDVANRTQQPMTELINALNDPNPLLEEAWRKDEK